METWVYSRVWKERAFVRTIPFFPFRTTDIVDQLNYY